MSPGDDEVILDALALIEAVHREDWTGAGTVARHANLRLVTAMLARICGDLIGELAQTHDAEVDGVLARLREAWTGTVA